MKRVGLQMLKTLAIFVLPLSLLGLPATTVADTATGSIAWQHDLNAFGKVVVGPDGKMVVTADCGVDSSIYPYDQALASNGSETWSNPKGSPYRLDGNDCNPNEDGARYDKNGNIYVSGALTTSLFHPQLFSFDPSGNLRWTTSFIHITEGTPQLAVGFDGNIYIAGYDNLIEVFRRDTGTPVGTIRLEIGGAYLKHIQAYRDGFSVVSDQSDGYVVSYYSYEGKLMHRYPLPTTHGTGSSYSVAQGEEGAVFFVSGPDCVSDPHRPTALSKITPLGGVMWTFAAQPPPDSCLGQLKLVALPDGGVAVTIDAQGSSFVLDSSSESLPLSAFSAQGERMWTRLFTTPTRPSDTDPYYLHSYDVMGNLKVDTQGVITTFYTPTFTDCPISHFDCKATQIVSYNAATGDSPWDPILLGNGGEHPNANYGRYLAIGPGHIYLSADTYNENDIFSTRPTRPMIYAINAPIGQDFQQSVLLGREVAPLPAPKKPVYVALGDSVAAGEGINYDWKWEYDPIRKDGFWARQKPDPVLWYSPSDTLPQTQFCHRSQLAYPWNVAKSLDINLTHLACSGAATKDGILTDQSITKNSVTTHVPAQIDSYQALKPDIITLSLGANDIGFEGLVEACYVNLLPGINCGGDLNGDGEKLVQANLVAQKANLETVLSRLVENGKKAGKMPLIVVSSYYDPFPKDYPTSNQPCEDLRVGAAGVGVGLTVDEVKWLRKQLGQLNANISDVAGKHPEVMFVDQSNAMQGHTWCTSDPYVFGPSIGYADAVYNLAHPGAPVDLNPSPFHPTQNGQIELAKTITNALKTQHQTPAGTGVTTIFDQGATVTFGKVTIPGTTTFTIEDKTVPDAQLPTISFRRDKLFNIHSSAEYDHAKGIVISIPSSRSLNLYHNVNGSWELVPSVYKDGFITGTVYSLSPFALGVPVPKITGAFSAGGGNLAPSKQYFNAAPSRVAKGKIADYEWDFGDGSTAAGMLANHTFKTSGIYPVRLTVTSDQGATDLVIHEIKVTNMPPVAIVVAQPAGKVGQVITFDGTHSFDVNGKLAGARWDFGDGSPQDAGLKPSHVFAKEGAYKVQITVFDDEGAFASKLVTIQIAPKAASGICLDGSYSYQTSLWSACAGHRGVVFWLAGSLGYWLSWSGAP